MTLGDLLQRVLALPVRPFVIVGLVLAGLVAAMLLLRFVGAVIAGFQERKR